MEHFPGRRGGRLRVVWPRELGCLGARDPELKMAKLLADLRSAPSYLLGTTLSVL